MKPTSIASNRHDVAHLITALRVKMLQERQMMFPLGREEVQDDKELLLGVTKPARRSRIWPALFAAFIAVAAIITVVSYQHDRNKWRDCPAGSHVPDGTVSFLAAARVLTLINTQCSGCRQSTKICTFTSSHASSGTLRSTQDQLVMVSRPSIVPGQNWELTVCFSTDS